MAAQVIGLAREIQNRVLDLIEETGARLRRETCPDWLRRPGGAECGSAWDLVCEVYADLTGMALPAVMPHGSGVPLTRSGLKTTVRSA